MRRPGAREGALLRAVVLAALAAGVPPGAVRAQGLAAGPEAGAVAAPSAGAVAARGVVVVPGDLLEVEMQGHPECGTRTEVDLDGRVALKYLGEVLVAGRTAEEIAAELARRYAPLYEAPRLTVRVLSPRADRQGETRIFVLGAVRAAGAPTVKGPVDLLAALALAGGIEGPAQGCAVRIVRGGAGRAVETVDLGPVWEGGAGAEALPQVAPGDTVVVSPARAGFITVLGEVQRPGRFPLEAPLRLVDALALANGLGDQARPVVRLLAADGTCREFPVEEALAGAAAGTRIAAGDALVVPRRPPCAIYVLGRVNRPGEFRLDRPVRLHEAIALAGGWTPFAAPDEVRLQGPGRTPGRFKVQTLVVEGRAAELPLLADGDCVYVP